MQSTRIHSEKGLILSHTAEVIYMKTDYSDIKFKNNGKLKLLIIVGTRPEIIRLAAVIDKCREYLTAYSHTRVKLRL